MNDGSVDYKTQMREVESKLRESEKALSAAKGRVVKLSVWSAIGGFMLFAVGGQWFPGYQLDSTAANASQETAVAAVSDVMAQLCLERFMNEPELDRRMAELNKAVGDWGQANYLRDGKWVTTPSGEETDHGTAEKCRGLIANRVNTERTKAS